MYQGKSGNDIGVSTLAAFARAGRAARGLRWRIGALAGSRDRQTRTSALDNDGGCVISEGNDASSSISNIGKVGAGECRVFRGRFVMDASLERCGDCITARREALPDPAIHRSRDQQPQFTLHASASSSVASIVPRHAGDPHRHTYWLRVSSSCGSSTASP